MVPTSLPRALLLDLDGTLVDSLLDLAAACNEARASLGFPPRSVEEIGAMVGDGARHLVARAFDLAVDSPAVEAPLAAFRRAYGAAPCVATTLLPGARRLLDEARRLGLRIALVTNKPREPTRTILERLAVSSAFEHVYAGGDGPLKPDPRGVLETLAALDVAAQNAWMIGDGPQDVLAARRASVTSVAVLGIASRDALEASAPDWLAADLDAVTDRLVALADALERSSR